jgi:hypothetical protein
MRDEGWKMSGCALGTGFRIYVMVLLKVERAVPARFFIESLKALGIRRSLIL